jgi:cytochrome b involved in lipid metabolism
MTAMKNFTADEIKYRDGGKTLKKLDKQAADATGADLEEIKKQQALYKKECWIIIHGIVYDVTNFLNSHPGGPDSILNRAGLDATMEFEDIFHSATAREQLRDMVVGKLDTFEGDLETVHNAKGAGNGSSESLGVLVPVAIVALAVIYFIFKN